MLPLCLHWRVNCVFVYPHFLWLLYNLLSILQLECPFQNENMITVRGFLFLLGLRRDALICPKRPGDLVSSRLTSYYTIMHSRCSIDTNSLGPSFMSHYRAFEQSCPSTQNGLLLFLLLVYPFSPFVSKLKTCFS